jgi:hypothetical protein
MEWIPLARPGEWPLDIVMEDPTPYTNFIEQYLFFLYWTDWGLISRD